MTTATPRAQEQGASATDPYAIGHRPARAAGADRRADASGRGAGGPASKRIVVAYGFWIFLLSDIIMFSAFFAAYAVLGGATAGGPGGAELFDQRRVGIETLCLLLSSFTAGMSSVAADRRNMAATQGWLIVTGLLGLAFLVLEVEEFADLIARGAGPQRSAFLSSFFALVGCHGLHVACGLLWLGTMVAQLWARGFQANVYRRFLCFNLFWHALDIVWVGLFTIVYLMGAGR